MMRHELKGIKLIN